MLIVARFCTLSTTINNKNNNDIDLLSDIFTCFFYAKRSVNDMHTEIVCSPTGHDVIIYFRSQVIAKTCRKYRLQRLSVEFRENGFSLDHEILHTYRGQQVSYTRRK